MSSHLTAAGRVQFSALEGKILSDWLPEDITHPPCLGYMGISPTIMITTPPWNKHIRAPSTANNTRTRRRSKWSKRIRRKIKKRTKGQQTKDQNEFERKWEDEWVRSDWLKAMLSIFWSSWADNRRRIMIDALAFMAQLTGWQRQT